MKRVGGQPLALLLVCVACFFYLSGPFARYMGGKPIEEKLGYVPDARSLRTLSPGMQELSAAGLVMKVVMYYGGLNDLRANTVDLVPDYSGMSRTLEAAVSLDPYNVDAYYFSQAFFTWEARDINKANQLLEHGMRYRTWDWYLPFFAGFNYAYFLKDYKRAAAYYKQAADMTGESLFVKLAGRYMQESGETELAIVYLRSMYQSARGELARRAYATRLQAFEEVLKIEQARDAFLRCEERLPRTLKELLAGNYLKGKPVDPYGGTFYLSPLGKVLSTSKFAYATPEDGEAGHHE